jgi:hypothetical protein
MSSNIARALYVFLVAVVCPLLAWNLAVGATNRGYGAGAFFALLLGVPLAGALASAFVLRRRGREAAFGAAGAVVATLALVAVLVFVWLSSR